MKIYESQGQNLVNNPKNVDKKSLANNEFQKMMDNLLTSSGKEITENINKPAEIIMQGIHITSDISGVQNTTVMTGKEQALETLKQTLDLVDFYVSKLSDTSIPSKEMAPIIENLEEKISTLNHFELNPLTPDKLKPVLKDVSITIGTEIAKFKRGDYL